MHTKAKHTTKYTENADLLDLRDNFGAELIPEVICNEDRVPSNSSSICSAYENVKYKISTLIEVEEESNEEEDNQGKKIFIQELSYKLNELQDSFGIHRDSFGIHRDPAGVVNREKPLFLNDVRITPGAMIFKDAYDGKSYNQTLTITNCGKHSVSIRIFPPTSKAFKIKPVKTGHTLSSGMSLVKRIRFLYTKPTAIPQAMMYIYVNNTCIRYELLVITCYTLISVSPKKIDFGDIDVGMVSGVKFLTITNSGTKQAQYSIDLGRNPMEVIVQPMKGTVQPGESKKVTVEVFGIAEGDFQQEFWIKTDPLQRVHIQGNFIEPTLKVDYPLADRNFLLLYFPTTFVGVRQQRNVVIKNHSSTSAVFCVMGRTKDEKFPLKDAGEKDMNYRQFYINPTEGRLHSDQQYIMGLTFVPQKPKYRPNYYICSVVVDVKRCRVGNAPKLKEHHPESQYANSSPLLDTISIITLDEQSEPEQEIICLNDMITILLYGEVEIPHITMEPRKLSLNNLKVNEFHVEPLKILNNSKTLPLTIKYNKIACVEVEPKTILLPPNQEVDAIVCLRPSKMGDTTVNIVFDVFFQQHQHVHNIGTVTLNVFYSSGYAKNLKLLKKRKAYFVPGITPLVTHEVGYQVDNVRFNSKIEKPRQAIVDKKYLAFNKDNDALIAFPNDRPNHMRPWRTTVPCKTIFAKIPRIVTEFEATYDLNPKEKLLKDTTHSYYKNYIKSVALKHPTKEFDELFDDYVTTNQKLILMQNLKMGTECPIIMDNLKMDSLFVPLTPYELHNLVVTPKFIQLGRLAAHTDCSNHFNVENKNGFPVHVSIKALYASITILQDQFILAPNSQKNINFSYHSDNSGTHHIPVFVILNFFHIFDVTVLARIVSNTVKCITKDILIVPTEKTAFLELRNPINSDVKFMIDTTFFHLESFPSSGVIPAKRNMTCTITFNPEVGYMPVKEIAVVSESGAKELVEVHFDRKRAAIALSTNNLNFGEVPLNTVVSKELTIKNYSDQLVPVNIEIENSDLFPEMCISPMRSLLWQKGDIVITFTVKFKEVVQFNLPVKILFQYDNPKLITVTGNVVFPDVNLSPSLIKIQKIPSGSIFKTPFRVTNFCAITNFLSFPLQDYPEFNIKTKNGENVSHGLVLGPKERRELFLEFLPQEPVAYCIYLPYILNGILGPPELNRPNSLKCSEYLKTEKNEYKTSQEVSQEDLSKLNVIKILCAAGKKWLHFRSLKMTFCSFNQTQQEFVVTNISNAIHEITFETTNKEHFQFIPSESNKAIVDDNFKTILAPEESFNMTIAFSPLSYGTFTADVPIYVKSYSETVVFNHLNLSGSNPPPQILASKKMCSFIPTHIGSRLEKTQSLELIAHNCNGDVTVECESPHIDVVFEKKENVSPQKIVLHYTVVFAPTVDCAVETKIKFSCQCPSSTEMDIYACGDSSIVINFMGDPEIVDRCTYPFFPEKNDKSSYAAFMHSMVPIIERWLYSQGYMYQNYYKIPDDIARYPVNTEGNKKKTTGGKKVLPQLPLVQLLINLIDRSILKFIDNGLLPSDDLKDRTLYNYVTYRNTISFLKSQGIFVPGLKPEHLLPYAEYVEYKDNLMDKERTPTAEYFSKDQFYMFSKQKWLDLFFRIYKILVFERIVDPKPPEPGDKQEEENDFLAKDKEAFEKYYKKTLKRFYNWYKCDAKLLLWLEYHYNRQRSILWPEEEFGEYQCYDNFCNIDDSVALATVTAAYCPYLTNQLRDVYACPKKIEHKVHNACRIVQVWKSLKLSFDVHPQTIVTGNRMKIVFIVTYLYEVLPHYYPTNDVIIEAQLSERMAYELNIFNFGDVSIKYVAIFFGEGSELFRIDNQQIVIPAKQSKKIRLTYFAKKVLEAVSILVLSGEAAGQKYAKSMAVSITGIPKTSECEEIKIQVETYEQVKKKISLQTPYGKNYDAKIYMCFEEPKSNKDFHAISAIKAQNIPREFNVIPNECSFIEKGEATMVLDMCFVSQGPKSFYLYFCNNDIGDFCVLISIVSITKKQTATEIIVKVPATFRTTCSCKQGFNIHCPKAFRIELPCRNPLLWKCTATVVQRCFADSISVRLIKKFFGMPIVFRMLKFYLERFPQGFMLPSCIFEDHAEFIISPNKRVSTRPSNLKIRDVTSEDSVPLIIHWNDADMPSEELLELRNSNQKEIRYFKLVFIKSVTSNAGISAIGSKYSTNSSKICGLAINDSVKESSTISSRSK